MTSHPFNDAALRDWLVREVGQPEALPEALGTLGSGPFDEAEFDEFLAELGVEVYPVSDGPECVVVGRESWTMASLEELIRLRADQALKVYSQEMLIVYLVSGTDPFDEDIEFVRRFGDGHPALEFLATYGFDWPTTHVFGGGGTTVDGAWPQVGLLRHMGYRVGKTNPIPTVARRAILRRVFLSETLRRVESPAYMAEWGNAASSARLQKLANTLATFCQNEKRRANPPWEAIEQREGDLAWIRDEFYRGRFDFQWPSTYVP